MNDAVMLNRLAAIDVVAVDSAVASGTAGERTRRLLQNRSQIALDRLPWLLLTTHSEAESSMAWQFVESVRSLCSDVMVVREQNRTETATKALVLHRAYFPGMLDHERKERILLLGRRGGGGKPQFIAPFVGGEGTTCGAWTPIVAYQRGRTTGIAGTRAKEDERDATPIRGFLRGNYAQGVCPAECSFCYLRGVQGMGIKQVLLNLEDAIPELDVLPRGSVVNWAELEHI